MKDKKILVAIAAALLVVLIVLVLLLLLRSCDEPEPILPDYAPQETEKEQESIPGDTDEKLDAPEGGGAVNITFTTKLDVDLSDGRVYFTYANPNRSTQDVMVAVVIGDLKIAESALINPGNQITSLPLDPDAAKRLQVGGYDAELIVYFYDTETGEKAMVDAKPLVTINVRE